MKLNFLNKAQAQLECEKSSGFSQMSMGMMMGIDPQKKNISNSDYVDFLKSHCLEWPEKYVKTIGNAFLELRQLLLKRKIEIGKVHALNLIYTTGREYLHLCHFVGDSIALPEDLGNSSLKSLTQDYNIPLIGKYLTANQYSKVLITALFHLWIEANLDKFKAMCLTLGYEAISLSLPQELALKLLDNRLEHINVKKDVLLKSKKIVSVVPIRLYSNHCLFDGKRHSVKEKLQTFMVVSQNSQGVYEPLGKAKDEIWFLTENECLENSLFHKFSPDVKQEHPIWILCDQFIEYVLNPSKLSALHLALFDNYFKNEPPKPGVASNFQNAQETFSAEDEAKPLLSQYQKISYSSGSINTRNNTTTTTRSGDKQIRKQH